ncbi:MAG: hypothetical protein H9533_11710 [Rhodobacteraceae bacterium]|nr:hypothetical protein [Paracoccaceae bacterium]
MTEGSHFFDRAERALRAFLRARLFVFVIGGFFGVLGHFFYGFWDFRSENMAMLREQYLAVIENQEAFEARLSDIDRVMSGSPLEGGGAGFSEAATRYIRSIETITRDVPEASPAIIDYVEAISQLRKYYDESNPPLPQSNEWMLFYGGFRQDFQQYVTARNRYFEVLSRELGSYFRYVSSS